jgi:hypothetical protein
MRRELSFPPVHRQACQDPSVISAKAGIQCFPAAGGGKRARWMPAFAGKTR